MKVYTRRKISPCLRYVTERGEGNTMDENDKRGVQGGRGFFPYALPLGRLPVPARTSAGWQIHFCVRSGEGSSILICHSPPRCAISLTRQHIITT
jgi:hypothetical protein